MRRALYAGNKPKVLNSVLTKIAWMGVINKRWTKVGTGAL